MAAKQVNPFYRSRAWKTKREAILRRDGYLCKLSRRYGKTCQADTVHHIYPLELYPEYALCSWNLLSVSSEMHNRLHNREDGSLSAEGEALMRATIPPSWIEKNRLTGTGGGNSFPLREKLEEKGAQNEPEEMEVQNRESVQRRRNV